MRVLIYGVNSENKGAELLLAAASRELAKLGHESVVNVLDVRSSSRKANNATGVFSIERLGRVRSFGLDSVPRRIADKLPIVGDGAFDFVLDASGYSLTDAWGMAPVRSRLKRLERWKAEGIGYAMLPQAFGPFSNNQLADGVRTVVEHAEVAWARDSHSLSNVIELSPRDTEVLQAPDITIPFTATSISRLASKAALLVPNWNLAERSGEGGREKYLRALETIARGLDERGLPVLGLCHEGRKDAEIIEDVARRFPSMQVINPASGVECKNIIAGAELVVAGRYHALVSALSSGVPAIGHSWSHKYDALMNDFGVTDGLANPLDADETLSRVDSIDFEQEQERLKAANADLAAKLNDVWQRVDGLIRNR